MGLDNAGGQIAHSVRLVWSADPANGAGVQAETQLEGSGSTAPDPYPVPQTRKALPPASPNKTPALSTDPEAEIERVLQVMAAAHLQLPKIVS